MAGNESKSSASASAAALEADPELDALAFEIYKQRIATTHVKRGGEQIALDSYRKAEDFLRIRDKIRSGDTSTKQPEGPQLSDCSAPNLSENHPHNMVSKRYGDLTKVNRIKKFLDQNPTPESDPGELVGKINREFPGIGWDLPQVNTARAIFPAYCGK